MFLPPEIVTIVATQLLDDPSTLIRLGQTNSEIYSLVVPVLYRDVSLGTSETLRHFCTAINKPKSQLGTHTRILALTSLDITFTKALAYKFRKTLRLMPNLQELLLDIGWDGVNQCFNDLDAPFALRKLRIAALRFPAFKSFISSQPSLTELQLKFAGVHEEEPAGEFFTSQPDVLPHLSSITATLGMLQGVIPGRPVTEVMISLQNWMSHEAKVIICDDWWRTLYCTSSAPVTATGIYSWEYSVDPWRQWIPALRKLNVHSQLKKFRIIEIIRESDTDSDDKKKRTLARRVKQLLTLGDFEQLEIIEVGLWHYGSWLSKDQVLGWLGDMSVIAAWRKHIPSLKQVIIFGVYLA